MPKSISELQQDAKDALEALVSWDDPNDMLEVLEAMQDVANDVHSMITDVEEEMESYEPV